MGLNTPSTGGGAPKDAEYVTGSSNSELTSETVVSPAGDILTSGSFGSTISLSPGFDTFTQVDANNPALVLVAVTTLTDGTTNASVTVDIDESGNGTATYTTPISSAATEAGDAFFSKGSSLTPLPAGGQIRINNLSDPRGDNIIEAARALILSP